MITVSNLGQLSKIVTIKTEKFADLKKRGNPLIGHDVIKTSRYQLQVGCDLQKIENRKAKAEKREPKIFGPLPYGEYIQGTPIIAHNGHNYIRGLWFKGLETSYTVDGKPATAEQMKTIREFSKSSSKDISDPINVRFDRIVEITGNKKTFTK